jgi:hypothetical protein
VELLESFRPELGCCVLADLFLRMTDLMLTQLPESWLSTRLGIKASEIERLRECGELFAERHDGSGEWCYPAWQFGPGGAVPRGVREVVRAARTVGLSESSLLSLLRRRVGLMGGGRLLDLLFEGRADYVVATIHRTAAA